MDRSKYRSTGAFRTASGGIRPGVEYHWCQECQRIYEVTLELIGLGSMSSTAESRERDRVRREKSEQLRELFAVPSSRCVCDPVGDVEFLKKREQEERERDILRAAMRERGAKRRKGEEREASPKQSNLGTTRAALEDAASKSVKKKVDDTQLIDQLSQLTDLFNAGALTKEQFEAAKNKLLGL